MPKPKKDDVITDEVLADMRAADAAVSQAEADGGLVLGLNSEEQEQREEEDAAADVSAQKVADQMTSLEMRQELERLRQQLFETRDLISKLTAKGENLDSMAQMAQADARAESERRQMKIMLDAGGLVEVLIHPHPDDPSQNFAVPITINGEQIKVQRGVVTPIPVAYLAVLSEARQRTYIDQVTEDGQTRRVLIDKQSYPFSVVRHFPRGTERSVANAA